MTDSFAVSAPTTLSSAQIDNWTLPGGAPTVPFEHEKFVAAIDVPDAPVLTLLAVTIREPSLLNSIAD